MNKEISCELLAKAKALAIKKGLDDTKVECPFVSICRGTRCYMFDPDDPPEENALIAEDIRRMDLLLRSGKP